MRALDCTKSLSLTASLSESLERETEAERVVESFGKAVLLFPELFLLQRVQIEKQK
jgi:hypothetical protein